MNGQFADVNGLQLYYEIHGSGSPLVLIHGGGSTIATTFGNILPQLSKTNKVIGVELQAHGHTPDIDRPTSFEQEADDIAALLGQLDIDKASFMGFSHGGTAALHFAIRYPQMVNKLVLASTVYRRDGMAPGFFEGMQHASIDQMPEPLKIAYRQANPDPKGLQAMFERDVAKSLAFEDISDDQLQGIRSPAFVINGDAEVVLAKHAMALVNILPHSQLAILPGGHGDYIGEICAPDKHSKIPALVTEMIEQFLIA